MAACLAPRRAMQHRCVLCAAAAIMRAVQCSCSAVAVRRSAAQCSAGQCSAMRCELQGMRSPHPVNPPRQSILLACQSASLPVCQSVSPPVRQSASPSAPARPCRSNLSPAGQSCPPVRACRVHLPVRSTQSNQPRTTPPLGSNIHNV